MVLTQARCDTVVEHHAVFVQHQAIAALAHLQLEPGVGVHPVQQFGSVRPLNVNFAQGRGIEHAHAVTHGQHFTVHSLVQVFMALGEIPGALPLADILKQRACRHMAQVRTGMSRGVEQITTFQPRKRAKGDRQIVGAEGGGAHLVDGFTHGTCGQGHAVDIAQLTLVGAKAQRGVAFDVLDGLKAFADREFNVAGAHVVLIIHKGFGATRYGLTGFGNPESADGLHRGFDNAINRAGSSIAGWL